MRATDYLIVAHGKADQQLCEVQVDTLATVMGVTVDRPVLDDASPSSVLPAEIGWLQRDVDNASFKGLPIDALEHGEAFGSDSGTMYQDEEQDRQRDGDWNHQRWREVCFHGVP